MDICKAFRIGIAVCLVSMLIPLQASADFQLVKEGRPAAVILLGDKPSKNDQIGAYELQFHIRKMTGTELPVVNRIAGSEKGNVIRIQADRNLTGDASRIEFKGKNLLLSGSDSSEYGKVDYQDVKTFPNAEYELKGVLFAVYDFLELYCGVRFYGIADRDTYYPAGKNLAVKEMDRRFSPPLDAFRVINLSGLWKYRAICAYSSCVSGI